ncbi:MAG: alpha-L-fucosidase [Gemmatimonadota bacterium]
MTGEERAAWPARVYRRYSVDIHVPDWHEDLLGRFDPEAYVDCMVRGGVQSLLQYTNSHAGLCLWRTEIGRRHAALGDRDFFGEVVAECRKRGIHPLAYFSVIFDNAAYQDHEDWRLTYADGSHPSGRYGLVCPNSPYREYAAACLREIAGAYDIAGAFCDMTFWPGVCYCRHCAARFEAEEGGPLPRVIDWDGAAWRAFHRARQRWLLEFAHLCTDAVRTTRPGITVNHQFSTVFHGWPPAVPLELTEACDYVGGDFYGGPTQHSLACKAYYSLSRSRPFEFHTSRTRVFTDHVTVKPMAELATEACVATLHSAALMLVDYINADGTLNREVYDFLGELSRQRAAWEPHLGGRLCADVAVYYDKASMYDPKENGTPIEGPHVKTGAPPHQEAVVGAARALQRAHIPFGVVTNLTLDQLGQYRAVVVPHVLEMTAEQASAFRGFVEEGGVLYASGPSSLDRFAEGGPRYLLEEVLGVRHIGVLGTAMTYLTPADGDLARAVKPQDHVSFAGPMVRAEALKGARVLARVTLPFAPPEQGTCLDSRFAAIHSNPPGLSPEAAPAAVLHPFGRGHAVWTAAPFEARDEAVNRDLFVHLLRRGLGPPFWFEAETLPAVEVTLFHQEARGRMVAGLLNLQQDLPQVPVGARLRVRLPEGCRPAQVVRLPAGEAVPSSADGPYTAFEVEPFAPLALYAVEYR